MFNPTAQARYVLPSYEEKTPYGIKTQDPYSRLFADRVIFLGAPIDEVSANDVMSQLLVLESLDPDRDVTLYINSPGGSMADVTALLDTMDYVRCDVATVCLGQAVGSAALLLGGGTPGKRAALPNARVVLQQPSSDGAGGMQASDIQIQAEEYTRLSLWVAETLSSQTGQSSAAVVEDVDRLKFMTAAEAKKYGLVDHVLNRKR